MDVSRKRAAARSSVVAGSVWESRMKSDEARGGIKVFNGGEENAEEGRNGETRWKRSSIGGAVARGKRKTWISENSEGFDKNQIQIAGGEKSLSQKNSDEQCNGLSGSSDGFKRSPMQARKLRSGANKELGVSSDKSGRSPSQTIKLRSETSKGNRDSIKTENQNGNNVGKFLNGNAGNSIQLRKINSDTDRVWDESKIAIDRPVGGVEEIKIDSEKDKLDENCKDFGVCQEFISSSSDSPESSLPINGDLHAAMENEADEGGEEDEEADEEIEIESEKESFDVKEISISESKVLKKSENKKVYNEAAKDNVLNKPDNKVVLNVPENKKVVNQSAKKKVVNEPEPMKFVNTYSRFHQNNERSVSTPLTTKPSPPIKRNYQNLIKANSVPKVYQYNSFPQTQKGQNKLRSLVDLIMWRDISRSAFALGIGTFIIFSSSYVKDVNLSFISLMSYLGLVYLAVIFFYRSIMCRGIIDIDGANYVLGEEEAIWVLKLILPYLNECLSKFKALFSGDPGTTMKLAVLLFVLARCGNSITIWNMAKFDVNLDGSSPFIIDVRCEFGCKLKDAPSVCFFGVFTVPKIFSSYSAQLTAYANFWVGRFRNAWESWSHKKAVAIAIFGLFWNLSSVVARIWAVFLLFVAFRYYQLNYLVRDEWVELDEAEEECEQRTNKVRKGF